MIVSVAPPSIVFPQSRRKLAGALGFMLVLMAVAGLIISVGSWPAIIDGGALLALFTFGAAHVVRQMIWPAELAISPAGIETRSRWQVRKRGWDEFGEAKLLGTGKTPSVVLTARNGVKPMAVGSFGEDAAQLVAAIQKARAEWTPASIPAPAPAPVQAAEPIVSAPPSIWNRWGAKGRFVMGLALGLVLIAAFNALSAAGALDWMAGRVRPGLIFSAVFAAFAGWRAWRKARSPRGAL